MLVLVHMSTQTCNSLAGFMYCGIGFLVEGPITGWNIPTVLEVLISLKDPSLDGTFPQFLKYLLVGRHINNYFVLADT